MRKTKTAALDLEIANLKKTKLTALDAEIANLRKTKLAALDAEIGNLRKTKETALNTEITIKRQKADKEIGEYAINAKRDIIVKIEGEVRLQFQARTLKITQEEYDRLKIGGATYIKSVENAGVKFYKGKHGHHEIPRDRYNTRVKKHKDVHTSGPLYTYYKYVLPQ